MVPRLAMVGLVLGGVLWASAAQAANEPLQQAADAIATMDYDRVVPLLGRAEEGAMDDAEWRLFWELSGTIHAIYGRDPEAVRAFAQLLQIDPEYMPPPNASPKISKLLAEARAREPQPAPDPTVTALPPPTGVAAHPAPDPVSIPTPAPPAAADARETGLLKRWYLWAGAGAVVLGGIALGVTLSRDPYPPHDVGVIQLGR